MKNKWLIVLIILDLFWCLSALIYDLSAIKTIHFYYWPFVVICPIYPLLLAIVWFFIYRGRKINNFLLAFAATPSMIYLVAALIYYPTWMHLNGFNLSSFGEIFWVAFYGLQGVFLFLSRSFSRLSMFSVWLFLTTSFIIQYLTKTSGYLDFTSFSKKLMQVDYFILFVLLTDVLIQKMKRPSLSH